MIWAGTIVIGWVLAAVDMPEPVVVYWAMD